MRSRQFLRTLGETCMDHSTSELPVRDNTVCQEMLPVFYRRDPGNSFKNYIHISHWPIAPNSRIDS